MTDAANPGLARPPILYVGSIALGLILDFARPVSFLLPIAGAVSGAVAIVGATGLFLLAVRTLRAAGTPVEGNRTTTAIVRAGPYRFSRNPIYLAFSLFQIGLALLMNSAWLLVTLVPVMAFMSLVVIPREERYLQKRFPSEYPPYKAAVPRWL